MANPKKSSSDKKNLGGEISQLSKRESIEDKKTKPELKSNDKKGELTKHKPICQSHSATNVDTFYYETTFVPFYVPYNKYPKAQMKNAGIEIIKKAYN